MFESFCAMFVGISLAVAAFIIAMVNRTDIRRLQHTIRNLVDRLEHEASKSESRKHVDQSARPPATSQTPPPPSAGEPHQPATPPVAPVTTPLEKAAVPKPQEVPSPAAPIEDCPSAAAQPASPPVGPEPALLKTTRDDIFDPARAPKKKVSLEEFLGARMAVWVGAITFAIAGGFFVKWGYDKQIITPAVSMSIAALFGMALIGGAQYLFDKMPRISTALAGAGTAVLFTTVWATVNMFDLFGPTIGFALMVMITIAAVFLSLRHGPFVALLGLLGGYLTPALMSVGSHNTGPLFAYLFLLEVGLLVLTQRRGWWGLSVMTLFAGMLWAAVWLIIYVPGDSTWVGLYLLGSAGAFVFTSVATGGGTPSLARSGLSWAGAVIALILMAWMTNVAGYTALEWTYLWLLSAGIMVLGRLDHRYYGMSWLAAAITLVMLATWRASQSHAGGAEAFRPMHFAVVTTCFGALFAGGGYAWLFGNRHTVRWACLSAVTGVAHLVLAYIVIGDGFTDASWTIACLILAAGYAVASWPVLKRRDIMPFGNECAAALVLACSTFIALAVPIALEKQWITVAWALLIPVTAEIERRLRVPALRTVAAILGGLVAVRLLLNPSVLTQYPVGDWPIFNWYLYGYGIPMLAFATAAWMFKRNHVDIAGNHQETRGVEEAEESSTGDHEQDKQDNAKAIELQKIISVDLLIEGLWSGAIAFCFALVSLEIRHFFHRQDMLEASLTFPEMGTFAIGWTAILFMLASMANKWMNDRLVKAAITTVAFITVAFYVMGPLTIGNPLLNDEPIGGVLIFNWLLYTYGIPAFICAAVAWQAIRQKNEALLNGAGICALLLGALMITLQVRFGFVAPVLSVGEPSLAEWATYLNVWLILGVIFLAAHRVWPLRPLRSSAYALGAVTLMFGVYALGIVANPLFNHVDVGRWMILNWLTYAYFLPGVIVALYALLNRRPETYTVAYLAGTIAVLLGFIYISLQVRQAYQGPFLDGSLFDGEVTGSAERYTYSVTWGVYGLLLLVGGIAFRFITLRWSSLAIMLIVVVKVFVFDTGDLEGLFRVFAYLGLGLSLMALGFLYQKFVFKQDHEEVREQATPDEDQSNGED